MGLVQAEIQFTTQFVFSFYLSLFILLSLYILLSLLILLLLSTQMHSHYHRSELARKTKMENEERKPWKLL